MRTPEDIIGIWVLDDNEYFQYNENYTVTNIQIEYLDGERVGLWRDDAYFYEPGYQILIYLNGIKAVVYKIVEQNATSFTWCWVKEIDEEEATSADDIGKLMGDIIKEAQEGFHLDPTKYVTFKKISQQQFDQILEDLPIIF